MKRFFLMVVLVVIAASTLVDVAPADETPFRMYYVVRHTEKADDGTKDPPLTLEGVARSADLALMLKDAGIEGFFASQYQRTQLTVKPLADFSYQKVTVVDADDYDGLIEQCRKVDGNVIIAGHSNTVPDIIKKLTGREFTIGHNDYDNLFVVVEHKSGETEVIRLHYGKRTSLKE